MTRSLMALPLAVLRRCFGIAVFAALLTGCGAESPEAQDAAAPPTAAPTAALVAAPATVEVAVEAAAEAPLAALPTVTPNAAAPAPVEAEAAPADPVDWTMHAYREGDYYILGSPDAPVRLIDYSDFL